jgi:hypothetical protein
MLDRSLLGEELLRIFKIIICAFQSLILRIVNLLLRGMDKYCSAFVSSQLLIAIRQTLGTAKRVKEILEMRGHQPPGDMVELPGGSDKKKKMKMSILFLSNATLQFALI